MMYKSRSLPHSLEAEEHLLSACLIDEGTTLVAALAENVSQYSFFSPANGIIWQRMCEIYVEHGSVDTAALAAELQKQGQLDSIGGYAYIAQISCRVPTTAQSPYFIKRVKELANLRSLVKFASEAVERASEENLDIESFAHDFDAKLEDLKHQDVPAELARPLTAFDLPPEDDEASLLGRNRYICRGDGVLIVSSAGMGKSSMSLEWAVCAALGRSFQGIETKKPLKSIIIQAEDSDGDVAEVWFSIKYSMKLTSEEISLVQQRVIIIRDKVNRGEAFIARLRILCEKFKPDLVWLNPLHSYAGCDIADAKEMGNFLRAGLNKANKNDSFAYMVIHHTPKPMTGKAVQDRKWHEFMYDAAGSAELINWARAVITLKPAEQEGEFNMILAKRGKRAGVYIEVKGEASTFLEITTKIPLKHSSEQIEIPGRKHKFNVIKWLPRDPEPDKRKSSLATKYTDERILNLIPSGMQGSIHFSVARATAREQTGIAKSTFAERLGRLYDRGYVTTDDKNRYYRTDSGDALLRRHSIAAV